MLDLNRSAMRANVLKEMATLLKFPALDELYNSTRTYTSLPYSIVDGEDGLQPIVQYHRTGRKIHSYLGIDRAFAPIAVVKDSVLQTCVDDKNSVEKLTTWQTNEWLGQCQSEDSIFRWRYARNREVAKGVRLLLKDLEKTFPEVRTRIVLPLREKAVLGAKAELEVAMDSKGKPFGRDYSRVWSSNNYADHIGEGMTMLDLSGLSTEPVLFGVRGLPESKPLEIYLRHNFADLADNFGSSFRGPRSFFFEAQESLRHKNYEDSMRRRGEIACESLAYVSEVSEVIYYEAADWLYYLPLSKPDVCSHAYVENCELRTTEKSVSDADKGRPWAMFRGNAQHSGQSPHKGPQTATQQWALQTGEKAPTSAAVGADGMIYVGIYDNRLYAIHPDGRVKWKFDTASVMGSSPAVTSDGIVYTPDHEGTLYAINPDGTQRWSYSLGSTVYASPTLGPDGTIYQGSDNGKLHAITPDGKAKWTYATGSVIQSTAAVGNDATIFFGANDHRLYAINQDGTKKWTFKTGGVIESSPAVANDGTVYVGSVDTYLHAINADGTKRWKFKTGGGVYCSPSIASDGSVIVGSFDHKVYCVRPDGTKKWSYKTKGGVSSSPAIGADGVIYIVSRDNLLHAINQDGTPRWQFPLPGKVGRSPAIGFEQTLYISGTDGVLYAIGPQKQSGRKHQPSINKRSQSRGDM
jgi:outer membrane protein assembly factor BamB